MSYENLKDLGGLSGVGETIRGLPPSPPLSSSNSYIFSIFSLCIKFTSSSSARLRSWPTLLAHFSLAKKSTLLAHFSLAKTRYLSLQGGREKDTPLIFSFCPSLPRCRWRIFDTFSRHRTNFVGFSM